VDACLKALQKKPGWGRGYNGLGNAYLAAGDCVRAAEAYGTAVQLEPKNARYIHNLGRACLSAGRYQTAVGVFGEVLRLSPASAEAYNDRASAYRELKELANAIADLRQAVSLRPEYALAHYNLGQAYIANPDAPAKDRAAALEHAQTAVRLTDYRNAHFLIGLAEVYRALRKYDLAVDAARQATMLDPGKEYLDRLAQYEQLGKQGGPVKARP